MSRKYFGCLVANPCDVVRSVPELQSLDLIDTGLGDLQYMVSNFCDPRSWVQVESFLAGDPRIYFTVGVHPQWTSHQGLSFDQERELRNLLSHPHCVGLREVGLDYHHGLSHPHRLNQQDTFRELYQLAH